MGIRFWDNLLFENIVLDEECAWGIGMGQNAIFQIRDNKYRYWKCFPDKGLNAFRYNSYMHKYKNELYCFPDFGNKIWVCHTNTGDMIPISIKQFSDKRMRIRCVFAHDDFLYALTEIETAWIIEIDTAQKKVTGIYPYRTDNKMLRVSAEGVVVKNKIYFTVPDKNMLCEFDMSSKKLNCQVFQNIYGLDTICYDGKEFWFSGREKVFYRWRGNSEKVIKCGVFPKDFGWYDSENIGRGLENKTASVSRERIFFRSICVGNTIFYIPFQGNKLLYIEPETGWVNELVILDEVEDAISWQRGFQQKYLLEYIRDNRYIGLYSFKNRRYLEVDASKRMVTPRFFEFMAESLEFLCRDVIEQKETMPDLMGKEFLKYFGSSNLATQ